MIRVALVVVALLAGSAAAAPDAKQLAKDKVTAAEKIYKGTVASLQVGRAVAESAYLWSVRWLDAELGAGKPIKQALADHLARMTTLETDLAKAMNAGTAHPVDHDATVFYKLEAELWVLRGKRA